MITTVSSPVRDRLVEAATELFYAQGLRAVSVDKVIDRAGTTKVTFYRHFKSKDDLVVDYLERMAAQEREGIGAAVARGDGDVDAALRSVSETLGTMACSPGFRGCPFINAAAEYPDPGSPVRRAVLAHREWLEATVTEAFRRAGHPDPLSAGRHWVVLRDGAMVAAYLDDPDTARGTLSSSVDTLLVACRVPS